MPGDPGHTGERLFPRLMIQVWTESTRTPALTGVLTDGYAKIRTAWGGMAESCKDAGPLPEDADVDARARAMIALVQGFATQMALLGDIPPQMLADGTRALMNVAPGQ